MTSIAEVLDTLGIEYKRAGEHHHVTEGWIGIDCPKCSPKDGIRGRFKLGINIKTLSCSCWTCGKISLVSALSTLSKTSQSAIISLLKQVDKTAIFVNPTPTKPIKVELPKNAGRLLKPHKQYLIKRGFNPNQITKLWQIYGIGISTTLSWRIVIPIFVNGELVSWTTRSISDNHKLRYISAPKSAEKVHHKHTLYGIDNCNTTIIITEGPFDVWRIGYGAVATFGVAYTREQVLLMKNFPRRIICFDNDAITQAYRLAQLLAIFDGQTLVVELDSKDPASAANKEISLLRKML